jgi:hypothetical protein
MIKFVPILLLVGCAPIAPPAIYDHPFSGELLIKRVPRDEANRMCNAYVISRTGSVAGCSYSMGNRCVVIISTDSLYDKEAVLRHEIAHCNGWPGDHRR